MPSRAFAYQYGPFVEQDTPSVWAATVVVVIRYALRMLRAIYLTLLLALLPATVLADGKLFAPAFVDQSSVQIPDQQALICFKDGVETLAIETRFTGKGTEFGWVVPLPSQPEITPATTGLFPTLHAVFAPEARAEAGAAIVPLCLGAVAILAILFLRSWWRYLGAAILLFAALILIAPSLGSARGLQQISGAPGVNILDRRIVGNYDVTTIASPDGAAVAAWLDEHQFALSPAARTVIADYAKAGWVFAAARLTRDADSDQPSTAHPLVFKFKADSPIYPMRLTGADASQPLSLSLFVFGGRRAAVDGLRATSAAPTLFQEPEQNRPFVRRKRENVAISHKTLRALVEPASFGTCLTGTLSPAQMARDLPITWEAPDSVGRLVFSHEAAAELAISIGLAALCILAVAARIAEWKTPTRRGVMLPVACLVAVVAACFVYAITPKAHLVTSGRRGYAASQIQTRLYESAKEAHVETAIPLDWARATLATILADRELDIGGPVKDEDSPGNYILRVDEGTLNLVWYDPGGAEHEFSLGPAAVP
ncbi:hypothetical protein PHYC_03890 [Phycisphaerales bacterium]|nr:hypothetical protein PHYC_03890 [Phycisphaerales bacterium]